MSRIIKKIFKSRLALIGLSFFAILIFVEVVFFTGGRGSYLVQYVGLLPLIIYFVICVLIFSTSIYLLIAKEWKKAMISTLILLFYVFGAEYGSTKLLKKSEEEAYDALVQSFIDKSSVEEIVIDSDVNGSYQRFILNFDKSAIHKKSSFPMYRFYTFKVSSKDGLQFEARVSITDNFKKIKIYKLLKE